MISFDALPGNRSLKASLRRALAGRVPQTILLSGDDSRSLETLSTALAAGILCEADGPRPCGACLSCRKVQDGVHPDLTLIDEGEEELKVDLARRIKAENAIIPNDGARRVTVIRHAHNMNAYAQNALLKELEEPPHFAFFILTSEKPDALLQTVRSRCTRFALEPSGEEQAVSDDEATRLLAPYLTAVAGKREGSMMLAALGMEKTPRWASCRPRCATRSSARRVCTSRRSSPRSQSSLRRSPLRSRPSACLPFTTLRTSSSTASRATRPLPLSPAR